MKNEGKITVFLSLMIGVMLMLAMTVFQAVSVFSAKEKTAAAVRSALSSVKAGYNAYIFEHYHILLFDKTMGGKGEAALEEQLNRDAAANLGTDCEAELAVSAFTMLYEDDCAPLKQQIADYMPYLAVEYGIDQIREATGGEDGTLPKELEEKMDKAEDEKLLDPETARETKEQTAGKGKATDPRSLVRLLSDGLLGFVLPEGEDPDNTERDISGLPSHTLFGYGLDFFSRDVSFRSMSRMKNQMKQSAGWDEMLLAGGEGLIYARAMFNSLTNKEKNTETVLKYEMEYLIAGLPTDRLNLLSVARRMVAIRMPVCFLYLVGDSEKMAVIRGLTIPLSMTVLIPEPVLTFLVAGAWSYAEAACDVRALMAGKRIAFQKNPTNWVTSLAGFAQSLEKEPPENSHGLVYEDYLTILMAIHVGKLFPRMLDLMEWNARQTRPEFQMEQAAVGLGVDVTASCYGQEWKFSEQEEY